MNFVNASQTPEERRKKYKQLRDAGLNHHQARQWRDMTQSHIDRMLKGLEVPSNADIRADTRRG